MTEKETPAKDQPAKPGQPMPPKSDKPAEIGGPKGPEPTRYNDWERGGRCIDF
jgi:hypothetical protein